MHSLQQWPCGSSRLIRLQRSQCLQVAQRLRATPASGVCSEVPATMFSTTEMKALCRPAAQGPDADSPVSGGVGPTAAVLSGEDNLTCPSLCEATFHKFLTAAAGTEVISSSLRGSGLPPCCAASRSKARVAIQRWSCLETQAAIERDSFVIAADDLDRDADCSQFTRQVIRLTCSKSEEPFAPMPWPDDATRLHARS